MNPDTLRALAESPTGDDAVLLAHADAWEEQMNKEQDLIGAGWLHPEEAESLQLYANRLRQKLYVATHCPECDRELPPRRCTHCTGILNEERS